MLVAVDEGRRAGAAGLVQIVQEIACGSRFQSFCKLMDVPPCPAENLSRGEAHAPGAAGRDAALLLKIDGPIRKKEDMHEPD